MFIKFTSNPIETRWGGVGDVSAHTSNLPLSYFQAKGTYNSWKWLLHGNHILTGCYFSQKFEYNIPGSNLNILILLRSLIWAFELIWVIVGVCGFFLGGGGRGRGIYKSKFAVCTKVIYNNKVDLNKNSHAIVVIPEKAWCYMHGGFKEPYIAVDPPLLFPTLPIFCKGCPLIN